MADMVTFGFTDSGGETATTRMYVPDGTDPLFPGQLTELLTDMMAISEGNLTLATTSLRTPNVDAATNVGPYSNVEDKAELEFVDADGNTQKYQIPSPVSTDFLPDDETVDEADPGVSALITDILAYAVTRAGAALIAYLRGRRVRVHHDRR